MSIDRSFICSLLKERGFSVLADYSITPDMLNEGEMCKSALEFAQDFYSKHGKMPEIATVEELVGVSVNIDSPEPVTFYADKIRERWLMQQLLLGTDNFNTCMKAGDYRAALSALEKTSVVAKSKLIDVKDIGIVDLRTNTKERMDEYKKLQSLGGTIDGLSFPWPAFNTATMGIHKGELWFFVARMKTGKSWIEVYLATHFFKSKKSVLLVTMEMPISKMSRRIDAVFSHLPYGDFQQGKLDIGLVERYSSDLEVWKSPDNPPFWVCGRGRVKTPMDLDLLIEEIRPDAVLVDGVYLMNASGMKPTSKWEKVAAVADELQGIAQRRLVPIIGTTQFNRKVKKTTLDGESDSIGFALELSQNCDGLIGLFQSPEMKSNKKMWLRMLEVRESEAVSIETNWDFGTMNFDQVAVIDEEAMLAKEDGDDKIDY
jgi:replicative DNA helicase